jgi:tellurite resistance protein TerC
LKATVKKVVVGLIGGAVLLVGIALIVLPGPAVLVIPAGLAILATEFRWAHDLKEKFKHKFDSLREKHRARRGRRAQKSLGGLKLL